jgi:AcrR family transcriptional regulator
MTATGKTRTKSEQTQAKIMAAARDLFKSRGYEQATMRDIAKRAGVALGNAYYYFPSKQDIVLAFYAELQEQTAVFIERELAATGDLEQRLRRLLEFRIKQLKPYRELLSVVYRSALTRENTLSPFSRATISVRERSIANFARALDSTGLALPERLAARLPKLLWLYHMGVIAFWLNDESPKQARTAALIDKSLTMLMKVLRLATSPLIGPFLQPFESELIGLMDLLLPEEQ